MTSTRRAVPGPQSPAPVAAQRQRLLAASSSSSSSEEEEVGPDGAKLVRPKRTKEERGQGGAGGGRHPPQWWWHGGVPAVSSVCKRLAVLLLKGFRHPQGDSTAANANLVCGNTRTPPGGGVLAGLAN